MAFPFRATDSKKLTRELQAASEAAVGCANNSATAAPPNSSKHNPGERKTRSADLGACTFPDEAKTTNGTASDADDSSWKAAGRKLRTTGIMSIRGSGLAIASASKMLQEKTQRVAQSQKTALRNFQLHGGLVRWLHGDDTSTEGAADDDGIGNGYASIVAQSERLEESQASTDSGAVAGLPLPPKAPSVASEAKGEQQGNGEQQQQQPLRRPSGGPADLEAARAAAAATAGFLRSSISRQRANSLLEGLYEKFKRAPSDTPDVVSPGRISLQPSPGRFSQRQPYSFANKIDTSLNIGFDDFVNSEGTSRKSPSVEFCW
ncbi:TPA: hypothetical protein N0F65_007458 [Lagenidium giganteum]|uniref:Uncharacterized protein n=1 Tax=Lagenidium giganteum TaxID=4803 RepID=A0AAV2ZHG2_9STRA|nr:TPA: hypothetical protein N0F65_007458 [Lagenidium giganteum]